MPTLAEIAIRYRIAALALAFSALLHAAVFVSVPPGIEGVEPSVSAVYAASLDAQSAAPGPGEAPLPAVSAPTRIKPRPRPRKPPAPPQAIEAPSPLAALAIPAAPATEPEKAPEPVAAQNEAAIDPAKPEVVGVAEPSAPIAAAPEKFPDEAFPEKVRINYSLTSAFADGIAFYEWRRDGDHYVIRGEAEAVGFFTLFLEGRILQETNGTVTSDGLRPERFIERRPNTAPEGLEFDWPAHQVTFERGDNHKTEPLTDNTVDWLSMIFQIAHLPPKGESYALRVFTQRRLYHFNLSILGEEEIEIPLGKVRALHLRHVDPEDQQLVDVWLGIDHHNLPLKLRYPVARNRLVVEQTATEITSSPP